MDQQPGLDGDPADERLADVAEAAGSVADIDEASLDEHAERYRAVHARLQEALSDTEER